MQCMVGLNVKCDQLYMYANAPVITLEIIKMSYLPILLLLFWGRLQLIKLFCYTWYILFFADMIVN